MLLSVSGSNFSKILTPAHRVIVHFDLDCFYAQVEMIRNPALRDVPLGKMMRNGPCNETQVALKYISVKSQSHIIRYSAEEHHSHL